jgi:Tfp pilus assembly protein PilF
MLCLPSGLLLSQQPDAFESLLASAQQAQARGDFGSAAEFYRQAVVLHPEIAELRANLGLMYYQTGKDEQAIEAFHQAIRLKPGLLVPHLFLGLDYVRSRRFNEAIPYLKEATRSQPKDIQSQLALAQAYASVGSTRLATGSYSRAAEIAPGNADVWYHLGVSYLEQVEADARILLTRHKDSAYLQALMADNFYEQQAFIQAAEAYRKALTFPIFPPGAHASYGFVLLDRHDLVGAEHELKSELASNPGALMAKLGFARLHLEQGGAEGAAKEIEEIWTADAGFLRANASSFNAGLPQAKRVELQRALEERQEGGDGLAQLANLFRTGVADERIHSIDTAFRAETPHSTQVQAGQPAELYAKGKYRECSDLLSSHPQALPSVLRMLVFCAYSTGDYRRAFDAAARMAANAGTEAEGLYWEMKSAQRLATVALAHASEMDSSSPKLHILLGDIYRQQTFLPDAEQEYGKALALQPEDTGALFGLSLALLADNQIDEAFHVTQAALKNRSDDPELNAVMGEILCARNDFAGAEQYLEKGLNTKPEYVPHVHALLGKVYARTGRTKQAIAELKFALADDKDGTVHYQIARLYLKIGDRNSAQQAFDVSRQLRSEGLNRATVAMQQGDDDSEPQ